MISAEASDKANDDISEIEEESDSSDNDGFDSNGDEGE